jgi:kynureninase
MARSSPPSRDPLLAWRDEFPIAARSNYLISNSLGAMPSRTRQSVQRFLDEWDLRGVRAWAEGWWTLQDDVARTIETILGVGERSVSMHQNVAVASECVLSCFAYSAPRNRIVMTELDFPSVLYLYEAQARRGAEIVRVPADAAGIGVDPQRLLEAIDERTLLVSLNHVLFRSSFVQDARAVVERARKVGAFVILDVFQSVGTYPLRLEEWGVHAAVGGALKYLCGGPGNCFLYVDPDERRRLVPAFTGWAAHRDPFAFHGRQDLCDDGRRFLHGTPNVPALYAGREGIRIVAEIGVDAIRDKSRRQTALITAAADRLGIALRSPRDPDQRSGHVALDVPQGYEVCQALLAEDIVVDYRPSAGLRLAPHFYTEDAECVAAVERVAELLRTGEHRRFAGVARKPG